MIEVTGNLWTYAPQGRPVDARVITTNGTVKKNGECVMGRGCAAEAKARYPPHGPDAQGISYIGLAKALGDMLLKHGNHVHELIFRDERDLYYLLSFPVKHQWMERADPALIERSAHELVKWASRQADVKVVVMPRPGCGNGGLRWEDVHPVLEPILDDRFHVITFGSK